MPVPGVRDLILGIGKLISGVARRDRTVEMSESVVDRTGRARESSESGCLGGLKV